MPYTYAKQGSKYTVYKKKKGGERGEKVGSTEGTKEALKKYLAALHASETTNENIRNFASKAERFFMPKDKNMKFKEDLKDLYYTNRPQYDNVKKYYMNQIDSGRQSVDIQAVMDAFNEIEKGIDESKFDDIKASPDKFTNWEYKDPKNPSLARRIVSKGRNANEAALYVAMRYPEYPDLNPQYLKDTGVVVSIIDKFVEAIYDGKTEAPERGETPYFMREMKTKLKDIVKELMADLPPIDPPAVPLHKATEMPAAAAMDQLMAQVNNMTLDQLYTLGKQISDNFPGFKPSFRELSLEKTEEKLRLEIKRFMKEHESIAPRIFNFDGNTITLKAMQLKENKMKVNQLKQIIREEISKALNEADSSVMGGVAKNLYLHLKNKKPNNPLDIKGAQLLNKEGDPIVYNTKVQMMYQNAAAGMDQMARQGKAAALGGSTGQGSEISLSLFGNLITALGFVKREEAGEALKYILSKYPNQLMGLNGGEPKVQEDKMDYEWATNYAPTYSFRLTLKDDKARATPQSAKVQAEQLKENKMKVNQLRQIIREEISKVLNEAEGSYTIVSWRGPFGDSYPEQEDSNTAMALSALGTTDSSGERVPADVWMNALKGVTPTGKLGDWLESSMGQDLNITIDPEKKKVTLKRESELAATRDAIDSWEKAERAASLARMGLEKRED